MSEKICRSIFGQMGAEVRQFKFDIEDGGFIFNGDSDLVNKDGKEVPYTDARARKLRKIGMVLGVTAPTVLLYGVDEALGLLLNAGDFRARNLHLVIPAAGFVLAIGGKEEGKKLPQIIEAIKQEFDKSLQGFKKVAGGAKALMRNSRRLSVFSS